MQVKKRDESIDILRFIAIIGIIIAHSSPNEFFVQLRGFDVVLMVFLSAVCAKGFDKDNFNYFDFLVKRCMRLILPVWIFFVFYYIGVYTVYYLPPISEVMSTFTFTSDKYVWIIRILVVLGISAPILWKITSKINYLGISFAIFSLLGCCEIVFYNYSSKPMELIMMTFPYAAAYVLGMNINKFSRKGLIAMTVLFGVIFVSLAYVNSVGGTFVAVAHYKYPPRLYYMSYGLAISLLLWLYRAQICQIFKFLKIDVSAKYIGCHTYWLYLWHIPFVDIFGDSYNAVIRFIIILFGSLTCVYIQDTIVRRFVTNKNIVTIFNG